jgi:adenine-specific DNA-methyltransferase
MSQIPSLPSQQQQMETRFVELMTELFQLDEAEALDFGIYRVIRRHNREVRAFLGNIVAGKESKSLQGGRLAEILDAAFEIIGHEAQADDKFRLKDLEQKLGLKPGMTQDQREAVLARAEGVPAVMDLVTEYRSRIETQVSQQTVQQDRAEVLNRLYQFFSRHYQDGDFIVERRYGKGGARYVKSTGEDTEFHWATEDLYYIKSGDIFTDFPVRLANGRQVLFTVDPESLQATRSVLKPNEKAHYELGAATRDGEIIKVRLKYLKGAQTEKQKAEIVAAVQKVGAGWTAESSADIRRWLGRFMARNQSDFFIHKRLKEALSEDLDIFLKTEVLDVDQLLAGVNQQADLPKRVMKVARIVREVGGQIIDFLAALEDLQKTLWEKKKLVFETRYVITLDRLERYAPVWLAQNIDTIVKKQGAEWKELGLGEYAKKTDCIRKTEGDLATAATEQYLPLPIDTKNFDTDFKWSMLKAVTDVVALDDALDGLAIQSDNWQALNSISHRYRKMIDCAYIDPPYNAPASLVPYKNSYKDASWLALMDERITKGIELLSEDAPMLIAIDDWEYVNLSKLLSNRASSYTQDTIIINHHPQGSGGDNVSRTHEYLVALTPPGKAILYTTDDGEGYEERPFMRSGTAENNFRRPLDGNGRYKSFYAVLVDPKTYEVKGVEKFPDKEDNNYPRGDTKDGLRRIYPISKDGSERVWRLSYLSGERAAKNGNLKCSKNFSIYQLVPKHTKKTPIFSNWTDSRYNSGVNGTNLISSLFGTAQVFGYPKSIFTVIDSLNCALNDIDEGYVIDYFGGSGTTAHAVMEINSSRQELDIGKIKFITVETNKYFESVMIPRLKKVGASRTWSNGRAGDVNGDGLFVRVQCFEQYDDTLESLDASINEGESGELPFQDPAFAIRYRLDKAFHAMYCGVDRFTTPFGYQLKRAEGSGEARPCDVDLVESIPYLLGMDVNRLYRESQGVVILGRNRRGQSVAVLFRDCAADDSAQWVADKLAQHPADRVYTNDPASLSFEGCDSLEAIETVFASQFRRQ